MCTHNAPEKNREDLDLDPESIFRHSGQCDRATPNLFSESVLLIMLSIADFALPRTVVLFNVEQST